MSHRVAALSLPALAIALFSAAALAQADKPETIDLHRSGAFGFPQSQARVLCDTDDLRVCAFTDNAHLYVQAVLWKDNDEALGKTDDGRTIGDTSILSVDADADGAVTAHVDRAYMLNPWPSMPGLRYSVELGENMSTGIQTDGDGSGAIRYVHDISGNTVRVDSYLISLAAIGRKTGDAVRIAYWGSSTSPALIVNSVGYKSEKKYWSYHLPRADYHKIELTSADTVVVPGAVPDGRQDDVPQGAKKEPLGKLPTLGEAPPELVAGGWINTDHPLTLAGLRGQVVVVEFWATWCGPCVAGIPHLNEVQKKYEKQGLKIVSFTDQAKAHVEEFIRTTPMNYTLGTDSELLRAYGVSGIPHAFIVGRDGKLVWHGHPATDQFTEQLEAALKLQQ